MTIRVKAIDPRSSPTFFPRHGLYPCRRRRDAGYSLADRTSKLSHCRCNRSGSCKNIAPGAAILFFCGRIGMADCFGAPCPIGRHCELREAIHLSGWCAMDCFAALAMTVDMVSRSRDALRPRFAINVPPSKSRAQGRPGARCTRGPVCDLRKQRCTRAYRYRRSIPAFPAQWLYGLYRALPGERLFCLRRPKDAFASPGLDASTATPEPHDFTVRLRRARRSRPQRPPHPTARS